MEVREEICGKRRRTARTVRRNGNKEKTISIKQDRGWSRQRERDKKDKRGLASKIGMLN